MESEVSTAIRPVAVAHEENVCNVKVAVRVRPTIPSDKNFGDPTEIINVEGNQATLFSPSIPGMETYLYAQDSRAYTYDACFSGQDPQQAVFDELGKGVLQDAWVGFNSTVFAYGQTGSGKSYTMMGTAADVGLIPRMVEALFVSVAERTEALPSLETNLQVSFFQIYNEKITDLLVDDGAAEAPVLRVRESPVDGPYVEGLSHRDVKSAEEVLSLLSKGNGKRTDAATRLNDFSSRSHAIFTIKLSQTEDADDSLSSSRAATMHFVDLAGSERLSKSAATGIRMKESVEINKSLSTLGRVILELSEGSKFVPYRDSVLTWILSDALGGNAKTIMLATVSPAACFYEETLSTLRFASRAKTIKNTVVANIDMDPNVAMIHELQAEVDRLRRLYEEARAQSRMAAAKGPPMQGMRDQLAHLQQHAHRSAARVKELEALLADAQRQLAEKDEEVQVLRANMHKGKGGGAVVTFEGDDRPDVSSLLQRIADLEAENGSLRMQAEQSRETLVGADAKIAHLKKQLQKSKHVIREMRGQMQEGVPQQHVNGAASTAQPGPPSRVEHKDSIPPSNSVPRSNGHPQRPLVESNGVATPSNGAGGGRASREIDGVAGRGSSTGERDRKGAAEATNNDTHDSVSKSRPSVGGYAGSLLDVLDDERTSSDEGTSANKRLLVMKGGWGATDELEGGWQTSQQERS